MSAHLDRVLAVVDRIDYRDDTYRFVVDVDQDSRVYVQLQHFRPDADTGVKAWGAGGKSYIGPELTDSDIVRRCLGAAIAYEEHEVREFFTYRGARVFGPHIDVEVLAEVAHMVDLEAGGRRACALCGCTDNRACPGGCSWASPNLCTSCVDVVAVRA